MTKAKDGLATGNVFCNETYTYIFYRLAQTTSVDVAGL